MSDDEASREAVMDAIFGAVRQPSPERWEAERRRAERELLDLLDRPAVRQRISDVVEQAIQRGALLPPRRGR